METTIVYWGYFGITNKKKKTTGIIEGLHRVYIMGSIEITEKKMETTIL